MNMKKKARPRGQSSDRLFKQNNNREVNFSRSANQLKELLRPIDYFSKRVELFNSSARIDNQGWCTTGLCPFHDDTKPGSLRLNIKNGAWCCFACDSKGGDVIAFEQSYFDISFIEALERLEREFYGRLV